MKPSSPKIAPGKAVHGKTAPSADVKKRRRQYKIGAGALLLLLAIWYWWPNAQLAKVRHMQQELFGASLAHLSAEEKKQKFEALRVEQEKLSAADRKEVRKDIGKSLQQKMNADAVKYLSMSPADRRKVIDERIAREQTAQKKQAAAGAGGNGGNKGGNGPGAGTGQAVAAAGNPRGPATPEGRDALRREFLLHATAEARAGMDQMKLDTASRRVQLGLPPVTPRGPGGR